MSGMPEASCARPVCADHADPGIDPGTRAVVPGVTDAIKIDVWSDIACPWCYIGKRNLEKGLAETASDADAPAVEVQGPRTPGRTAGGSGEGRPMPARETGTPRGGKAAYLNQPF